MDCSLCKKQKYIISENINASAIICKFPLKNSHILVIPKKHIENLSDFTKEETKDFLDLCEKMLHLSKKFCKKNEEPFLFKNYGKCITQKHIHFHIVPSSGCLRNLVSTFDKVEFKKDLPDEEMKKLFERLKNNL